VKNKDGKKIKKARQRFEVHSGEGRRFNLSRLKQGFVFYVLLLLALVFIVQVGYHWLGDQFLAWRLQVVPAEQGVLEQEEAVEGLVTRSEEVITAPVTGVVLELAEAGERVPVGKDLARIGVLHHPLPAELDQAENEENEGDQNQENPFPGDDLSAADFEETLTITSEKAGLLSYYIDGLEDRNGPYYPAGAGFQDQLPEGAATAQNTVVKAGQPLLKIVDNWKWFFNIVLPLHPGRSIAAEQAVNLVFDFAPGENVRAELYHSEIDDNNNEVRLSYLIERQLAGFEEVRRAEASLLYARKQGVIVPAEAVFDKNQTPGVYLNRGGRVVFQPVAVAERQEGKAMVEGVEPHSLVIIRHDLVEEGQRLD